MSCTPFGEMFFKVQAWIFVQLIVFQAPSLIFVSYLTKEELAALFIHSCKIFICKVSLKWRWECAFKLSRKNFEHSCHQVANFQNGTFERITITVTEVVLIQVLFLTIGSKHTQTHTHTHKIKMKKQNTMAPSYHSKVSSTQITDPMFLLFGSWSLVL